MAQIQEKATNEWHKYKKMNGIITGGFKTADIPKSTSNRCAKRENSFSIYIKTYQ
jgi:hypothetical protein